MAPAAVSSSRSTMRARVAYVSRERVRQDHISYEELAEPKWKGKVCLRSGQHPYNLGLIAAMIARRGEAKTREWLAGLKANLAVRPSGNDRSVEPGGSGNQGNSESTPDQNGKGPERVKTFLNDEYVFVVQPILAGHGPTLFAGLRERLELRLVGRQEFRSGAVALRYQPSRVTA